MALTSYPEGVYPPSEDTFLLADALEADLRAAGAATDEEGVLPCDPQRVSAILEIGCGSGFVAATAATLMPEAFVLATDVSSWAADACRQTLASHARERAREAGPAHATGARADVVVCESLSGVRTPDGRGWDGFDVVLVNPPYVPTPDAELDAGRRALRGMAGAPSPASAGPAPASALALAWAGGEDGVRVVREMITEAVRVLAHPHPPFGKRAEASVGAGRPHPPPRLYLLLVQENDPEEVAHRVAAAWREQRGGGGRVAWRVCRRTRAANERLSVLRFVFEP